MTQYTVAQAKDSLSRLIDSACAGETVVITRRGRPMIRFAPADELPLRDASAWDRLQELRESLPPSPMSSVELLNAIYEDDD